MSYSNSDVAHRWANGLFGKSGEIKGSNMSGNEMSLYSYSTIIAQALDREKNVFIVIDEYLSSTTSQHVTYARRAIPDYALVISTHFDRKSSGFYGRYYDDAQLLSYGQSFDKNARHKLISHFVYNLYAQFADVCSSNKIAAERINRSDLVNYAEKLNAIYHDCSLKNWLRNYVNDITGYGPQYRKLVRLIIQGKSDEQIADALFGVGTWSRFQARIASKKKALATRKHGKNLFNHLLYSDSLTAGYYGYADNRPYCPFSIPRIRKLSVAEILAIRDSNLYLIQRAKESVRRYGLYTTRKDEAYKKARKFLGLPSEYLRYNNGEEEVYRNGERIYRYYPTPYWNDSNFVFDERMYAMFCAAVDKHAWRERFWRYCELKQRRIEGRYLWEQINLRRAPITLSDEQQHILNEYIVRQERHEEIEAKKQRTKEMEALRQVQEKLERLACYRKNGIEGLRQAWREHLQSIEYDVLYSPNLCYGGNILLRFAKQPNTVETSKGIRLSIKDCLKYFAIIKEWHDNGTFTPDLRMAGYRVESFDNDILVAGCHRIAYCEMERMYNEILKREAA